MYTYNKDFYLTYWELSAVSTFPFHGKPLCPNTVYFTEEKTEYLCCPGHYNYRTLNSDVVTLGHMLLRAG